METHDLPPELAALERELAQRPNQEPRTDLRGRVLAGVRRELCPRRPLWAFAAAAAAVLLGVNLSLSVASNGGSLSGAWIDASRVEETAARLRALAPELPEGEVYRLALLAQAGAPPAPAPALLSPDHLQRWKEQQEWVMR